MWKKSLCLIALLSGWASIAQLTCPELIVPSGNSTNSPLTTLVQWTDIPAAIGYEVSIGTTPFENDILEQTIYDENFTEQIDFPPNSTIYVVIIPFNNTQFAVGCEQLSFMTTLECSHQINSVSDISLCDMTNGLGHGNIIDQEAIENELIGEQQDLVVTFYDSEGNAIDLTAWIPEVNEDQFVIWVRATDVFECFKETSFIVHIDSNLCEDPISIRQYPRFFTPNGDGFNDFWRLSDADSLDMEAPIFIYDRFGILVYQLEMDSQGWDGNYKGSPLPASDYWFSVDLENNRQLRGHFALKR